MFGGRAMWHEAPSALSRRIYAAPLCSRFLNERFERYTMKRCDSRFPENNEIITFMLAHAGSARGPVIHNLHEGKLSGAQTCFCAIK